MKFLFSPKGWISTLLLIFIVSSFSYAQITIEERVEINSVQNYPGAPTQQNSTATTYFLPCGPYPENPIVESNSYVEFWEVIWYGKTASIGINQNFMPCDNNPPNQTWNVDFIEGTEYIRVRRYDSNQNAGFHLEGLTWSDQNQYIIYFDQLEPVDSANVTYQVYCPQTGCLSAIRHIVIKPNFELITGSFFGNEMYASDELPLYSYAENQCGSNDPPLKESVTYNVEIIQGGNYGSLRNEDNQEINDSFTGLLHDLGDLYGLTLITDGDPIAEPDSIIARFSTSDPTINPSDFKIYLLPPPLKVMISPETLSPGDTADVIIKKRNADGTLEDFPPEQLFEIGMIEGCEGGNILADGNLGPYFYDVMQPIYFAADSTITDTTITVGIRVGLIEGIGTRPIKGSGGKESENKIRENLSLKSSDKNGSTPPLENPTGSYCFIGEFYSTLFGDGEVVVNIGTLDHFEITIIPDTLAEKDTLAFGEGAKLIVQAKDVEDNDVELQSDKLLTFKVEINESYGTFIDVNGDTLRSTPVVLSNITYQNANDGKIKFAAVKENPDSFVTCNIKVYLQEDTSKIGEREAVVLEQTLKIVMDGDHEVEPIITRRKYDEGHRDYIINTTEENTKQFSIKLTRGGEIVHNHKFILSTNYVSGSGGHNHNDQIEPLRPNDTDRLMWQNYGRFYSYQSDSTINPLIEDTSIDTILNRFNYIASIWGDTMKIYLKSVHNSILKDSIEIIERIPTLNQLEPNENFILIGGTIQHHGPQDYQDDHNHFGTDDMRMHILDIAADYRAQLPDEPLLNINDMSLPFGGKFDINPHPYRNYWRGSHVDHREGTNVDIRSRDMEGDRYYDSHEDGIQGVYDPDPINNPTERLLVDHNDNGKYDGETLEIFRDICEDNEASWVLLENPWNHNGYPEHWHLTF